MVKVYGLDGNAVGEITLPAIFHVPFRADLIQRAVLAMQTHRRQPYGTDPLAGQRTSAHYHGSRKVMHEALMMNREMARAPRTHGTSPGQEMRARFVPHARSGREAHPPKAERIFAIKINDKERIRAIASAVAATALEDIVKARGHKFTGITLPIVVDDALQSVGKTKELQKVLTALKLDADLARAKPRKVRPGRGKMRGRKYRDKTSLLIVVAENKGIMLAAKNLHGVDIENVKNLNAELLAPGGQPGRLTVWTRSAVAQVGKKFG